VFQQKTEQSRVRGAISSLRLRTGYSMLRGDASDALDTLDVLAMPGD